MNILLLGGTGAMGRNLCKILTGHGHNISVTSRSQSGVINDVNYVKGNALDFDFLKGMLSRHWDVIVDFMVYQSAQFAERVQELLESTNQYIFLSSSRVYADCKDKITENSPRLLDTTTDEEYLKTDEYALCKAREENLLRNSGKKNWTIIRPYITFDPYRLQLGVMEKEHWLYRAIRGRTIVFSEDIAKHITTMTSGYDVANGIVAVMGNDKALGEAFHITADESHSWQEILSAYIDVLEKHFGREIRTKMLNQSSLLGRVKYQVRYDRYYDRKFDNSKISNLMPNYKFSDVLESLRESLQHFLQKPKFLFVDWKLEARHDRISGEIASWNEFDNPFTRLYYYEFRFFETNIIERVIFKVKRLLKGRKNG